MKPIALSLALLASLGLHACTAHPPPAATPSEQRHQPQPRERVLGTLRDTTCGGVGPEALAELAKDFPDRDGATARKNLARLAREGVDSPRLEAYLRCLVERGSTELWRGAEGSPPRRPERR